MKLSKKNAARQRALQKAIASGKALGGMLVGFAASVVGCVPTMGRFPAPNSQENAKNENTEVFVTEGEVPAQGQERPKTNAGREAQGGGCVLQGDRVPFERRETPKK